MQSRLTRTFALPPLTSPAHGPGLREGEAPAEPPAQGQEHETAAGFAATLAEQGLTAIAARDQPPYPGNRELEARIASLVRWNAMAMVVRGNGKIIQELEAAFRGSGWDPLLAADGQGRLLQRMQETVDGQYQKHVPDGNAHQRVLQALELDRQHAVIAGSFHDPEAGLYPMAAGPLSDDHTLCRKP